MLNKIMRSCFLKSLKRFYLKSFVIAGIINYETLIHKTANAYKRIEGLSIYTSTKLFLEWQ